MESRSNQKRNIFKMQTVEGSKNTRLSESLEIRKGKRAQQMNMVRRGVVVSSDSIVPENTNENTNKNESSIIYSQASPLLKKYDLNRNPPECIESYETLCIVLEEHVRTSQELSMIPEGIDAIPPYIAIPSVLNQENEKSGFIYNKWGGSFKISRNIIALEMLPIYVECFKDHECEIDLRFESLICIRRMIVTRSNSNPMPMPWPVRALCESGIVPFIALAVSDPNSPLEWKQEAFLFLAQMSYPSRDPHSVQPWDATAEIVYNGGAIDIFMNILIETSNQLFQFPSLNELNELKLNCYQPTKENLITNVTYAIFSLGNVSSDTRSDYHQMCIEKNVPEIILKVLSTLYCIISSKDPVVRSVWVDIKPYVDGVCDATWWTFSVFYNREIEKKIQRETVGNFAVFIQNYMLPQYYRDITSTQHDEEEKQLKKETKIDTLMVLELIAIHDTEILFHIKIWEQIAHLLFLGIETEDIPIVRLCLRIFCEMLRGKNDITNIRILWKDVTLLSFAHASLRMNKKDDQIRKKCCEIAALFASVESESYSYDIIIQSELMKDMVMLLDCKTNDVQLGALKFFKSLLSHMDIIGTIKFFDIYGIPSPENGYTKLIESLVTTIDPKLQGNVDTTTIALEIILHVLDNSTTHDNLQIKAKSIEIASKMREHGIGAKLWDVFNNSIKNNEVYKLSNDLLEKFFTDEEEMGASSDYGSWPYTSQPITVSNVPTSSSLYNNFAYIAPQQIESPFFINFTENYNGQ